MNSELILACGVAIVTAVGVLLVAVPLLHSRDRREVDRLRGRIDELGLFVERLLRVVYGAETRNETIRREDIEHGRA